MPIVASGRQKIPSPTGSLPHQLGAIAGQSEGTELSAPRH